MPIFSIFFGHVLELINPGAHIAVQSGVIFLETSDSIRQVDL